MSATPPAHDTTSMERILQEQHGCAESMLEILDQEHQALLDGNAENLNRASEDKARVVDDLEALERARQDLATTADANLSAAPDPSWTKVLELIKQCRERNLRNGALANARREQVLLALNTLRGSGSDNDVYNESGAFARGVGARRLGEA